jgi:ubiquinone/menaquinone biosynthesis C-methylase UbiE
MAKFYDASMKKLEEACLSEWRSKLLSGIEGEVLEIGSGTGINLSYYPDTLKSLLLTEPEPHMLGLLEQNINDSSKTNISAEGSAADALDVADHSIDAVVSTLVICSVDFPVNTLNEIKRVLKLGGKLYFLEHVLAKEKPHLIKWQKFFEPFWICMCGNCHLTRDTEKHISDAGFTFETIDRTFSTGGPGIVSPTIKGVAVNP